MENFTDKEMASIMDGAGFPKGLTFSQMIKIAYWSMFNRKRLNKFCHNIKRGMAINFAFKDSNN